MLDDLAQISKLDKSQILSSIHDLPEQIRHAWDEVYKLEIPSSYNQISNIVVAGMGGSGLGGRIVRALDFKNLRVPIEVITNYHLHGYVNDKTLVILSSYSGGTEETIEAAYEAIKRKSKIIGITTGGKLEEILKEHNLPFYKIDPVTNPSNQPRMGLGYSIAAILAILSKCKFINFGEVDIKDCIDTTEKFVKEYGVRIHTDKNIAKKLSLKLAGKFPVLMASEHLIGVVHAFKNQINENAKTMSMHFEISEANHHLMEGLRFPHKLKEIIHFVFFESKNYYERIQKRYPITEDVISQNGYKYDIYKLLSENKVDEVFEILVLGSYISFYMAMIYGIDPAPIPWVDYFKEKMQN